MSGKQAKKLRKALQADNEVSKRNYKRLKKKYLEVSGPNKSDFIKGVQDLFNPTGP
jgi:hypothetical protein